MSSDTRRKIAVIGAGMTGLCTLRHFTKDPRYEIVAFERSSTIAGIWNYPAGCEQLTNETDTSPHYSRIYRDLRTNSPRDLSGYPDAEFPFPKGADSYCHRSDVLKYYHDYTTHFNLWPLIKFRHQVVNVRPLRTSDSVQWEIQVLDLNSGQSSTELFDNVIVCNGHYHQANEVKLEGLDNFQGSIIHSSQYRVPEIYANKTVLVVGARSSAMDIACEIIPHAKQVIIYRRFLASVFRDKFPNVRELNNVVSFGGDHVVLSDGSTIAIDAVILCTGFVYHYPFLSAECHLRVSRGRVAPLYRHLIHCEFPSLVFVGLANMAVFAHVADAQVRYYKAVLDGKVSLPSTEEMLAECEKEFEEKQSKGAAEHMTHEMTVHQWPYIDMLAKEAAFPSYQPATKAMFEQNILAIRAMPYGFRQFHFEKVDADNFIREPLQS